MMTTSEMLEQITKRRLEYKFNACHRAPKISVYISSLMLWQWTTSTISMYM